MGKRHTIFMKTVYGAFAALLVLAAAPSRAAITIADSPLFLTVVVPPNITLTLDDSLSMAAAFVPELCRGTGNENLCDALTNRYAKSAHHNLLYYNPAITYPAPKDAAGTELTTTFASAHRNGFVPNSMSTPRQIDLSANYRPTANLSLTATNNNTEQYMNHFSDDVRCSSGGARRCEVRNQSGGWSRGDQSCSSDTQCRTRGVPAYYYVFDRNNGGCNGSATNNACYDIRVVSSTSGPGGTDERQNFANWYSFARTRTFATQTAASLAFVDLPPTTRVAWQALNSCTGSTGLVDSRCDGWTSTDLGFSNRIRDFTGDHKRNFFTWLFRQPTIPNTPLRTAMYKVGEYYRTSGNNSPYDNDLNSSSAAELACRRNYHVMMTDGLWRTPDGFSSIGNWDNTARNFPEAVNGVSQYTARAPYRDTYSDTLADVAFRYWATDLRTNLDNILLPSYPVTAGTPVQNLWNPRNDPATWQHMVNFTIGLGLSGYLSEVGLNWNGDMYDGSYNSIANGTTAWPQPGNNRPQNVADLWHAAINSRGQFFSADDPESLSKAFRSALTAITDDSGSAASLSANSTSLRVGSTVVYQARFNASDWSGSLLALPVSSRSGAIGALMWDASAEIPAHGSRRIFTHNGSTGAGTKGVEFRNCTDLSAGQQDFLNTSSSGVVDNQCAARIRWLRGDQSTEVRNGGAFRDRPRSIMGDIINSDPAYAKDLDYGYAGLPSGVPGQSSYASYVSGNASRTPIVYVGANDGRLYAINADTGAEVFSYIPLGVYHNLSHLTDPSYSHRYFVDGAATVRDAYVGTEWKTILVGGLNAGGTSIYALDVTNPNTFDGSNVMWEYTDADMGHTFSQPQIAILESGQWVAIFGNGYNSTGGGAHLYVVDLADGTLIRKLTASDQTGVDESNGLSTPALFDEDGDMLIDTVYAGDLRGNLWKFDLSDTGSSTWNVAFGAPLFRARNGGGAVQAITAQPSIQFHPLGGQLVIFGTGKYLSNDDVADTSVQTLYGIWDNGAAIATTNRSELAQQSFELIVDKSGRLVRASTSNSVDWSIRKGWYLDMVFPPVPPGSAVGERVVSKPLVEDGRAIFTSVIPSRDPCVPGGASWLTELDFITGSAPADCAIDIDGDGAIDENDEIQTGNEDEPGRCPSSLELTVGISKTPVWLEGDGEGEEDPGVPLKIFTGTAGTFESVAQRPPEPPDEEEEEETPGSTLRRSWIQIR